MDGNGETTFLCKDLAHHPTETTIKKWMFRVPGKNSGIYMPTQPSLVDREGCDFFFRDYGLHGIILGP